MPLCCDRPGNMVSLISLLLTAAAIVGGVAAPTPDHIQLQPRQLTLAGSRGYHDGFFYYYWTDGGAPATYRNLEGGSYSLEWGWGGNLIGGKGWENGTETRYGFPSVPRLDPLVDIVGHFP